MAAQGWGWGAGEREESLLMGVELPSGVMTFLELESGNGAQSCECTKCP